LLYKLRIRCILKVIKLKIKIEVKLLLSGGVFCLKNKLFIYKIYIFAYIR